MVKRIRMLGLSEALIIEIVMLIAQVVEPSGTSSHHPWLKE